MSYTIKEIYYTLQGEGFYTGRPAVFCRFTGCNLWSGRAIDRKSAICNFCDTDFVGTDGPNGGNYNSAIELARIVDSIWQTNSINADNKFIVCTGGEPLLQFDSDLVEAFHSMGFSIAIETNGTIIPPDGIDWISVSPKIGAKCILTYGDELKLVYPQENCDPNYYLSFDYTHHYLQPMSGPKLEENTKAAIEYCSKHPKWNLSIQTHKLIGLK